MTTTSMAAAFELPAPTPQQLAMFRAQLDEQRQFRLDQLDELQATDPGRFSDVTELLAAGAQAALRDVQGALYRLDTGTYGRCTDCGTRIAVQRLEVLPQVGQCLDCRRQALDRPAFTTG